MGTSIDVLSSRGTFVITYTWISKSTRGEASLYFGKRSHLNLTLRTCMLLVRLKIVSATYDFNLSHPH